MEPLFAGHTPEVTEVVDIHGANVINGDIIIIILPLLFSSNHTIN